MVPDHVIKRTVHKLPQGSDKADHLRARLGAKRLHVRQWPVPEDAELVLSLHFTVHTFGRNSYHADATLELPMASGFEYATVSAGGRTQADALLLVIRQMESSFWFHYMREHGVRFRVTGAGIERLYRGYL